MLSLIVMRGLPCSGKSTLAEGISRIADIPVFSVDPIEAAMWRCGLARTETGVAAYEVAGAMAEERLKLRLSAIIDAVNGPSVVMAQWNGLAQRYGARLVVLETVCSDEVEHRRRVDQRQRNIPGMPETAWERVEQAKTEIDIWPEDKLIVDSMSEHPDNLKMALKYIATAAGRSQSTSTSQSSVPVGAPLAT